MCAQSNSGNVSQYKQNQFITADRGKILLMMFAGAIRFITEAAICMKKKDRAGQGLYIGKAIAVIAELKNSLDYKKGGDISISLERLYDYMARELSNANIKGTPKPLEVCLKILNNLNESYTTVVNKQTEEVVASQEENPPSKFEKRPLVSSLNSITC